MAFSSRRGYLKRVSMTLKNVNSSIACSTETSLFCEMTAENYDWKNAFKKNRVIIVKGLANPDEVANELFQSEILNVEMHETILQIDEKENKTRKILETLNYRGKKGVAALHDAFMETQNKELAKKLAPYVIEVAKRDSKMEPKEWPPTPDEEMEMLKDDLIAIKDTKSPWFIHEYGKEYVYEMQGKCRGKVFIINNVDFSEKMLGREASDLDAENLEELFKKLHFSVQRWDNLTADKMISYLYDGAEQLETENNAECVVLIIMSHGGGNRVYGVDSIPVELKTLIDVFSSVNCPSLHGKPRLVFVQACRSDEIASIEKTNHLVKHDAQVEIECHVKTDKPVLEIFWKKDERPICKNEKYSLQSTGRMHSLVVTKVEGADKGVYQCIVKHEATYQTNPAQIELTIEDASIKKLLHLVEHKKQVQVECIVDVNKQIRKVSWERDIDGVILSITEKTNPSKYCLEVSKGISKLIVQEVTFTDEGKYRCFVKYEDGSKIKSNPTEIKVNNFKGMIASITQSIHLVKPGGQVIIDCSIITNNPIRAVSWEKDAKGVKHQITENTSPTKYRLQNETKTKSLVISNVEDSDAGEYRCIVKHEYNGQSNPTVLDILDVPHSNKGDVTENKKKGSYDETDSVPAPEETKVLITPICSFPDHPRADFLIAYATPEGN
ncbi:Hypothetical predicted protein [Mytilus galloprovincialis]|uniref:Uncharacterized protein n=1 Tax=Mytilus galloprovincialis TaxID=29158 RepID=A0A8B6GNR3_MYTGA|nr:Hypothetical predicted protein [Mytilus galloprovincialis]